MPFAGDPILASDVNTRIAVNGLTADTVTWAGTESGALHSVTGSLVTGTTYRIRWVGNVSASVAGDSSFIRIRQDTATGTQIAQSQVYVNNTVNTVGFTTLAEAEFTASATAAKTFVITGIRTNGTGNGQVRAAPNRPALFSIEKINSV